MNPHKIALLVLLAACARPAYSGSASAGEASSAPAASPAAPAAKPAPVAPSAGVWAPAKRPGVATLAPRSGSFTTSSRTVPVLVIPAKEMDPGTYSRVVEDLSVMSRIIEKSLRDGSEPGHDPARMEGLYDGLAAMYEQPFLPSASAGPRILRASGGRPKAIYVGGYGAVFSLQVNFPLVPPAEAPEPNKAADKGDQVWAAAQRELVNPPVSLPVRSGALQGRPYRSEAVEMLRSTLVSLLKHATNIRELEPESWLTILVQGPGTVQDQPEDLPGNQQVNLILGARTTGTSLLTLRAKKTDIDQFAKGQLDQTQFQQRVQITTY